MTSFSNPNKPQSLSGSNEYPVVAWLEQLQDLAETTSDQASARSLRLAREITLSVQTAYKNERERGADTIDVSSAIPTALAHALIAIGGVIESELSLLEIVRVLASETFATAERLAAIAEEQLALPSA